MMQSPLANISPVVKNLLIINVICFLPYILFNKALIDQIYLLGSAHYFGSGLFEPWQPITYMFLHWDFWHIMFNMFALFSFGSMVEYVSGSQRFMMLYFLCGLGGLAGQWIVQAIEVYNIAGIFFIPADYNAPSTEAAKQLSEIYFSPMVGASGAIFGILIAFGMLYPNLELMILFIPIPVKAKYVIPVYVLIELVMGLAHFQWDPIAHFAHLGGAVLGFILVKMWRLQGPRGFY